MTALAKLLVSKYPPPAWQGNGDLGVDGNTYYTSATVEGKLISVGDSVTLLNSETDYTYIAKVIRMWETPEHEQKIRVNWYARRQECPAEIREFLLRREILLTEETDECPLDSILDQVTVYIESAALGKEARKWPGLLTTTFFCNRGYLAKRNEFIALSTLNRLLKSAEFEIEIVSGNTRFDLAKAKLQLNFVSSVCGRREEIEKLTEFVQGFISRKGQGGCIYVSGVPGTGKTLVVREVMRELALRELAGELSPFGFFEINCLRIETPRDVYSELYHVLTNDKLSATAAQRALNDMFLGEGSPFSVVVLVDEIDVMLTHHQNELYCLLEWSSLPQARFTVIAVANLMDLETRLHKKIGSRMGKMALKFFAYKEDQLSEIIQSRVGSLNVFSEAAIKHCVKTIARNGGDARKALESCRRALEMHEGEKPVNMDLMSKALRQITAIQADSLLMQLSRYQKLFLTAALVCMDFQKRTVVPMIEVVTRATLLGGNLNIPFRKSEIIEVANELVNLCVIKGHREGTINASSAISLVTFDQTLLASLGQDKDFKSVLPKGDGQ
jgi:origin recognition complex subunit 1